MLVEIPDPEVILGIVVAFLGGLLALCVFTKIRPYFDAKKLDPSHMQRLEYYERQLIDMKIRLDSLDMVGGLEQQREIDDTPNVNYSTPQIQISSKTTDAKQNKMPNIEHSDITTKVLEIITKRPMTSRDIQITLGRTREHTSRLMKKLFQKGFVERNATTKPYSYSISNIGKKLLEEKSLKTSMA